MQYQDQLFPEDREKHKRSLIYGTLEFNQAYSCYIASPQWKKLARKVNDRAKGVCERCRKPTARLEAHHLTYERFQHELLKDLQALCKPCHDFADRLRKQQNQEKFEAAGEEAQYSAAQHTYFAKKYGEDWYFNHDNDPVERMEEFDTWLEKKREQDYNQY